MKKELVYSLLYETYLKVMEEKNESKDLPEEFKKIPLDEKIKVLNKAISTKRRIEYKIENKE